MQLPRDGISYQSFQQGPVSRQHKQLPSLQDIIKLDEQANIEKKFVSASDWDCSSAFTDCGSSSTTPTATSPTYSIGGSMPTLTSNLDDLSFRNYNDEMLSNSNSWGTASQYSNGITSYASSTSSSNGYYTQPSLLQARSRQNLPSLTEMNLAQSSPVYNARNSQLTRHPSSTPYYCGSPTDPLDISYAKSTQGGFGSSMYNQTPRTPYTISNDYSSHLYDPYCYPNGTSWPPSMQCGSTYVGSDTASMTGRRRRGNLPKHVTEILRAWFHDHLDHPYPTDEDKQMLIAKTNLTISQIGNWFINARRRHWPALKAQREQIHKLPGRHS